MILNNQLQVAKKSRNYDGFVKVKYCRLIQGKATQMEGTDTLIFANF